MNSRASIPGRFRPLAKSELRHLARLEAVLTWEDSKSFHRRGRALAVILAKRWYRNTHGSFTAYCRNRCGMSRIQAYRLIRAARLVDFWVTLGNIRLPHGERVLRPLEGFGLLEATGIWVGSLALARGRRVSAVHVRMAMADWSARHDGHTDGSSSFRRPLPIQLTCREFQIACSLNLGRDNQEVADELHLTLDSVKSYIKALYRKFHVHRRNELLARLREQGTL